MPKSEKNFKRQVRARMARTGESYATARANLEARSSAGDSPELPEADDLLQLARTIRAEAPRVHAVSTSRWYRVADQDAPNSTMLQSARPSAERKRDQVIRSWSGETWLELDPTSDSERGQPVDPARWREEGKYEGDNSEGRPWSSAFSGGVHWEDGPNGLHRHQADATAWGSTASRIVNPFWNARRSILSVVSKIEFMERRAAVVRVSPTEASNIPADFQQEVTVDLETGCCLGYIGFRKGRVSFEWRASEISFPLGFDEGFFDPPAGRVVVDDPWPRHFGRLADLAGAVPFELLVPRVLPEKADLFRADVARVAGSLMAHLAYRQSHTGIPRHLVFEEDARPRDGLPEISWQAIERNGRSILVSDTGDGAIDRIARVRIGETRVTIHAIRFSLEELVAIALSLEPVDPGGRDADTVRAVPRPPAVELSEEELKRREAIRASEVVLPADPRSLEGQFQLRCGELVAAARELGFNPVRWILLINELGAVGAARQLLEHERILPVTRFLVRQGRPELTMEHEMMEKRWADLFTDEERVDAARRLNSAGGSTS